MLYLVQCRIPGPKCLGKNDGLLKREAQAVSGNRVHGTGRIADQDSPAANHTRQPMRNSHAATLDGLRFCTLQSPLQSGKLRKRVVQPKVWMPGQHRDSSLLRADGCHINLADLAPMNFYEIRPWPETVVPAKAKP